MTRPEFGRLRRLMALSTSDSDPEALGALRAANRLLAANGVTWDRVFDRCVVVLEAVEAMEDGT